MNSVKKVKK